MSFLVRSTLALALLLGVPAQAQLLEKHQGRWMGDLRTPDGPTLKIGADLFRRADGTFWASIASPDQGAYNIPVKRIDESGATLDLDFSFGLLKMKWTGEHFAGAFHQGGDALPITLRKVAAFPIRQRPQTPSAPFPYREEALAIRSEAGVTLGATLTIAPGDASTNAVVLVHGSGPQTRDSEFDGHQQFAVLADYLTRRGIAVLRYDKRGIAHSTGDYEQHTVSLLATDLHAAVLTLRARKQFRRIGVVAISEGPEVAARVAAGHPGAMDFIVSLAGVGLPGLEALLLQDRVYARDQGANADEVAQLMIYVRKFYQTTIAHEASAPRVDALKALHASLPDSDRAMIAKFRMNVGTLSYDWAAKPFMRASLMSDPPAFWRSVRVPVLALNGSLDHQVPADENLAGIVAALRSGGNRKVEWEQLPSLNHLFQTAKTGKEDEYGNIEETMAPVALKKIAAFVSKQ